MQKENIWVKILAIIGSAAILGVLVWYGINIYKNININNSVSTTKKDSINTDTETSNSSIYKIYKNSELGIEFLIPTDSYVKIATSSEGLQEIYVNLPSDLCGDGSQCYFPTYIIYKIDLEANKMDRVCVKRYGYDYCPFSRDVYFGDRSQYVYSVYYLSDYYYNSHTDFIDKILDSLNPIYK